MQTFLPKAGMLVLMLVLMPPLLMLCVLCAADAASNGAPLDLWERVEKEVAGRGWLQLQATFHFRLRQVGWTDSCCLG